MARRRRLPVPLLILALSAVPSAIPADPRMPSTTSTTVQAAPIATDPSAIVPKTDGSTSAVDGDSAAKEKPAEIDSELLRSVLPFDISTASFYELVSWLRSLGLSEAGAAQELRARLYAHFGVDPPIARSTAGRVVTIERASEASYFNLEEGEGSLVRASGGVLLTLRDEDGSSHRIEAREIVYDRERNAMTARGGVRYVRESAGTTEVFIGEALSADLNDWSGVFLDGKVRRAGENPSSGDRGLVMDAQTMIRRSANVLVFDNGVVSSCDEDDPHYAVRAGKVWLLGDNEWAVADAVFSVGNVPILYLPFFYYPGDEIVFHPVLGYRSREGRFAQTTTYLIGSKPRKEGTTGILSFNQKNDKGGPARVKGLFLRRIEEKTKAREGNSGTASNSSSAASGTALASSTSSGPSGALLKVMLDAYSSLGYFAGAQGSFPRVGALERLDFSFGMGLSRSIFGISTSSLTTQYSPFSAAGGWSSVWNSSEFMGLTLPLRFGLDLTTSLRAGSFGATLTLPVYSDPFYNFDFKTRYEDMDWLKLFSQTEETRTITEGPSSLAQSLVMNYSWKPSFLDPFVSSIDLSRLSASMSWLVKSKTKPNSLSYDLYNVDPARRFFYPDLLRPVDGTLSVRGTLFRYPAVPRPAAQVAATTAGNQGQVQRPGSERGESVGTESSPKAEPKAESKAEPKAESKAEPLPELRVPWADEEEKKKNEMEAGGLPTGDVFAATQKDFRLPARAPSIQTVASTDPWTASVDWNVSPSAFLENRFIGTNGYLQWAEPSDIDFRLLYQLFSWRVAGGLESRLNFRQDLVSSSLGLTWTDQDQSYPYLETSGDSSIVGNYQSNIATYRYTGYQFKNRRLAAAFKLSSRPFADSWLFSATSFAYSLDAGLYNYKYFSMDTTSTPYTPVYKETTFAWDKDSIVTHNASFVLGLRPGDLPQTLGLTVSLPPTTESYSARLALDGGPIDLTLQSRAFRSTAGADISWDPITAGIVLGVAPWPSLSDSFVYDAKNAYPLSNTASLSWKAFSSSLVAKRSRSYDLSSSGWTASGVETFRLTDLNMRLQTEWKSEPGAELTGSLSGGATLSQSLLRFSESAINLNLTAGIKISKLLDFSISYESQNTKAWRYYSYIFPAAAAMSPNPYKSPLTDIGEAFSIWDPNALKRAFFKMKNLSFKVVHDLHDWDLTLEVSAKPLLKTYPTKEYVIDTSISFLLTWRDISDIKSSVKYNSNTTPNTVSY